MRIKVRRSIGSEYAIICDMEKIATDTYSLRISARPRPVYKLGFPNYEVRKAFSESLSSPTGKLKLSAEGIGL